MKRLKGIAVLLAVVLAATCLWACKKDPVTTDGDVWEETDTYLARGGFTDYRIVTSATPTSYEQFAVSELKEFFHMATGATLREITDEGLAYDESQKWISVGDTALSAAAGVDTPYDVLGRDGARVVTKGNILILTGATDRGTVNAVYDFLHETFGYECYAPDEIKIEVKDVVRLRNFNITDVPSFAERSTAYAVHTNSTFALRMRSQAKISGWAKWTHSEFHWMKPEVYAADNPDWFSDDQLQLCITRDVGDLESDEYDHSNMRGTYVEGVKDYLIKDPSATHMMLGIVDNRKYCTCESCMASDERYGGQSGSRIRFYNAIVRELREWLKVNYPGRHVTFACFAYLSCFDAPVNYDEASGTYTAVDPSVIPDDDLAVLWAPMDACYAHSFNAPCNSVDKRSLDGWAAIAKHLYVWSYCTDFTASFLPFDNFNSLAENYKLFADYGVEFFYDQGNEWMTPFFNELFCYVQTKLMWDVNLDYNALVEDFMQQYYKDAAPYMLEYFNLVRTRYALLEAQSEQHFEITVYGEIYAGSQLENYFPYKTLCQMSDILDRAADAAAAVEDETLRQTLTDRIRVQTLVPRYFLLRYYRAYYSDSVLTEMIDSFEEDCAAAGVSYVNPNGTKFVSDFIAELRG